MCILYLFIIFYFTWLYFYLFSVLLQGLELPEQYCTKVLGVSIFTLPLSVGDSIHLCHHEG
jgi:hypothetical protein